jgi:hypothetical protein
LIGAERGIQRVENTRRFQPARLPPRRSVAQMILSGRQIFESLPPIKARPSQMSRAQLAFGKQAAQRERPSCNVGMF